MAKLVLLSFGNGSFDRGFSVTIQIWEDNQLLAKFPGKLPPDTEIPNLYSSWQSRHKIGLQRFRIQGDLNQVTTFSKPELHTLSKKLGQRINTWINSEMFRPAKDRLLIELKKIDEIRIIVETENIDLQRLPWHLWEFFRYYPNAEVSLSHPTCERINKLVNPKPKARVLAILGDSSGIDIEADRRLLKKLSNANAEIVFLVEPKRQEIDRYLWDTKGWDILFFAGHSERRQICINPKEYLTVNQLKNALKTAIKRGLRLAIFNSCDCLELARDLADLHLPQMIVMREPIPDRVAQEFIKYFLEAFSRGEPLYLAVREARERLQVLEDDFPCATWLPVLCQNPAEAPLTWQELYSNKGEFFQLPAIPIEETMTEMHKVFDKIVNKKPKTITCPVCSYENVESVIFCEACGSEIRKL